MMNEQIDQFLLFFPWNDCRAYQNISLPDGSDERVNNWKEIVLNCLPVDCEYLIKSTYTDAVTIITEFLLLKTEEKKYTPSINQEYLLFILSKCKESRGESPYPLLLSQVFLAYFRFFHHEDIYESFCKSCTLEDSQKSDSLCDELSARITNSIVELHGVLTHPRNPGDVSRRDKFFAELIMNTCASTSSATFTADLQPAQTRRKRNSPWESSNNYNKQKRTNEETKPSKGPYYAMPTGRLPLLSHAVNLVTGEEFIFDRKPHKPLAMTQPPSSQSAIPAEKTESGPAAAVHRRQKIKRKRFRLVFYDENYLPPQESAEGNPAADQNNNGSSKMLFDPHNFDENDPAIRKSGYLALKGVVALTNTRYRVQLNAFKHEKRKFSRNTSDLNEALWIFEVCLLVSDSPTSLSQQMKIGNYQSLVVLPDEFRYFRNPIEYFVELGRQILLFSYTDDCFPKNLIDLAIGNFENMTLNIELPEEFIKEYDLKYGLSEAGPAVSPEDETREDTEKEFWREIFKLFKSVDSTLKSSGLNFTTFFKKCPQPQLPPRIYMSKEE